MILSKRIATLKPSSTLSILAKAKKLKAEGVDVINFSGGEPDFNTPENICDAAIEAIHSGFTKYTDSSGTEELRSAICKKLKDDNGLEYIPSQVIVSNGAKHALHNAFFAILNDGDEVLIPSPHWVSYPEIVKLCGGVPVFVDPTPPNHKVTVAELEKAVTPRTKALIINSPSNPTGVVYTRQELMEIADFVIKHDLLAVSDEIYEKLIYNEDLEHVSIASFGKEIFERTIVINGFSKSYSMTGWRVGYSASNAAIAKAIAGIQSHCASNVNSMAQKAAVKALSGNQDNVLEMKKVFAERRNYLCERLAKIPHLSFIRPEGAFYVFVDVSGLVGCKYNGIEIKNATDLGEMLLDGYNVAVVPGADFGRDNSIRMSFPISVEVIGKGLDRIEEFVEKITKCN